MVFSRCPCLVLTLLLHHPQCTFSGSNEHDLEKMWSSEKNSLSLLDTSLGPPEAKIRYSLSKLLNYNSYQNNKPIGLLCKKNGEVRHLYSWNRTASCKILEDLQNPQPIFKHLFVHFLQHCLLIIADCVASPGPQRHPKIKCDIRVRKKELFPDNDLYFFENRHLNYVLHSEDIKPQRRKDHFRLGGSQDRCRCNPHSGSTQVSLPWHLA